MYAYGAYGLCIHSCLRLPELIPSAGVADVVIQFGSPDDERPPFDGQGFGFRVCAGEVCLAWAGVGAFVVRRGCQLVVAPDPGAEERVLRLFILGPALAMLLHQRGLLVLHATTVSIADRAVIFLGESGGGKSTMAAVFSSLGHALVSDDVTAVSIGEADPCALPGFPQLKLLPDALLSLGCAPEALPLIHPHMEKRAFRVPGTFPTLPVPLLRIYRLAGEAGDDIELLRPQEAFRELARVSYLSSGRFSTHLV